MKIKAKLVVQVDTEFVQMNTEFSEYELPSVYGPADLDIRHGQDGKVVVTFNGRKLDPVYTSTRPEKR